MFVAFRNSSRTCLSTRTRKACRGVSELDWSSSAVGALVSDKPENGILTIFEYGAIDKANKFRV